MARGPGGGRITPRRVLLAAMLSVWAAFVLACGVTDYSYDLPGDYRVWHPHGNCTSILGPSGDPGQPAVGSLVVGVAWDERYVLIRQERIVPDRPGSCHGRGLGEYQFWVLDTRERARLGPFDKEQFASLRAALGIAPGLELRPPASFAKSEW